MRRALVTAAAVALASGAAACGYDWSVPESGAGGGATASSTAASASSADVASSTATGGGCDGAGSCEKCTPCAVNGVCASEWKACQASVGCSAILDCAAKCADVACAEECKKAHADGVAAFDPLEKCVACDACPNDCKLAAASAGCG